MYFFLSGQKLVKDIEVYLKPKLFLFYSKMT